MAAYCTAARKQQLRQRDGAQHARALAQRGRHQLRRADVAREPVRDVPPHALEQARGAHHAAAQGDPPRREHGRDGDDAEGEITRL